MRVADLSDAFQRRVRVHHDRIRRVPVSREELLLMRRPLQGGDLRGRGEGVEACARGRVPNVYGRVVGTAASCEERALPGAPRKGLQGYGSVRM